jgi:serine/threonine protein kinase
VRTAEPFDFVEHSGDLGSEVHSVEQLIDPSTFLQLANPHANNAGATAAMGVTYLVDPLEAIATDTRYPPESMGPTPMHPAVGEWIEGFEIIGLAPDQGAESDLYFVRSRENQKCVFKLYRPGMQPATGLSQIPFSHPRIISPLSTGTWNGRSYEITLFFEQRSLAHLIERDGPLKLSVARLVLRQILEGLTALHRAGIQHRDLKPSNILIKSENPFEVVLTDFGSSALATMTLLTQVHTTLAYAAPETLTGLYSRASDYWSLGIILIEILTGQNPLQWYGSAHTLGYQIVQGKVAIPDSLPAEWQLLLKGLLQRDHYKRWDNARVLRWLNETDEIGAHTKVDWFRRLILGGAAAVIIALGSLAGVGIWQLAKTTPEQVTSLSTTNRNLQPSVSVQPSQSPAQPDLSSNPWFGIGFLICAWIVAIGLFLIGFGHCISGAPHGFGFICGGVAIGVVALYLPQWLR